MHIFAQQKIFLQYLSSPLNIEVKLSQRKAMKAYRLVIS
jgi:hypothetical protein